MTTFERDERWADEVAIAEWQANPHWDQIRKPMPVTPGRTAAIREAYSLIQRRIGPSPIREVAFIAALLSNERMSVGLSVRN